MMPDSPDPSILTTPQITRSGRRTKAPAAFGNGVTSDHVYASDDEDEAGIPIYEADESPEWGEMPGREVLGGDEAADESDGDVSADEKEGSGKSKAAKTKKRKKEPSKPHRPAATSSAKSKAPDSKKQGRTVGPARGPPKPAVTKPSAVKAKDAPAPRNIKLPAASKKPALLPKSKTPTAGEKTPNEKTENQEQENPEEAKDTSRLPDVEHCAPKVVNPSKALLPAAPILPAQISRVDLSGPERSSVPNPTTSKRKPKGIVLAKKGSMVPAASAKAGDKDNENSAKKAVQPGLFKAQPKAKSEVEEKPAKVVVEKKPGVARKPVVAKPVAREDKGDPNQGQSDEKHAVPTDSAPRGNAKRDKKKKQSSVKEESAAVIGTCFAGHCEDGEWLSDAAHIDEAKHDSGPDDDDQDVAKPVKAKTDAKATTTAKKRQLAESDGDEEETSETHKDKKGSDDEDSVMTAVEEDTSEGLQHRKSKPQPAKRTGSSGGKRKVDSQEEEDSGITRVDGSQEVDETGNEFLPDAGPVSKKRKVTASQKTTSRTTSSASTETDGLSMSTASQGKKPAPAEKVPAEARLAMVEAMGHKDYIKLVDWQGLATSFKSVGAKSGPGMTPEKLKRHWREVLSADLRDLFRGTSRGSGSGGKAGTKEGLTKVHRKAIWKALYDQCDKLDWKTVSQEADGMAIAKLKRHFKEAMKKDVDKMVG